MKNDREKVNPLSDLVFSCMFRDMNASNVMRALVNSVIEMVGDDPISEIVDMQGQYSLMPLYPSQKIGRLDVKAKGKDGEAVDLEVQLYADDDFIRREFFYGSKMSTDSVGKGMPLSEMKKSKVIGLSAISLRDERLRELVEMHRTADADRELKAKLEYEHSIIILDESRIKTAIRIAKDEGKAEGLRGRHCRRQEGNSFKPV